MAKSIPLTQEMKDANPELYANTSVGEHVEVAVTQEESGKGEEPPAQASIAPESLDVLPGSTLTDNQKAIADSLLTAALYAKNLLPGNGLDLLNYITSEIGKISADKKVTTTELITAAKGGVVAICNEAKAPHVGELLNDVGDFVVDSVNGQPFEAFKKLLELPHDIQDIKKYGK